MEIPEFTYFVSKAFAFELTKMTVLFLFCVYFTNRFLLSPYGKLFAEREDQSIGARQETERLVHEVQRSQDEYREKASQAQREVDARLNEMKRKISQKQTEVLDQFRAECHGRIKKTQEEVKDLLLQERKTVDEEAKKLTNEIVKTLLA